jgi:hypothetical protein
VNNINAVADILSAQSNLNESVAHALQALALTTDRYDDALGRIYGRLSDIEARLQDDGREKQIREVAHELRVMDVEYRADIAELAARVERLEAASKPNDTYSRKVAP